MHTQFLILGQGLCGTWLSYFLEKEGRSFIVVDEPKEYTASRVASGVINPVTGRKLVKTWMAETLLPFAEKQYGEMGNLLREDIISPTVIRNFFPTPQMKEAYVKAAAENEMFVQPWQEGDEWKRFFDFDFGAGEISPAYRIRLRTMLDTWRDRLLGKGQLMEEAFQPEEVVVEKKRINYKHITADYLICCDGVGAFEHPWFSNLPFAPNKGEALLLSIPELPEESIYKKGITLVPWDRPGVFWAGSTYELRFSTPGPTEAFRNNTMAQLKSFLKVPFELMDHWAAVRPATVERRPFAGVHPLSPRIGILNGMGTKGCSLAPWFAREMIDFIMNKTPVMPAASIDRFSGILTRR